MYVNILYNIILNRFSNYSVPITSSRAQNDEFSGTFRHLSPCYADEPPLIPPRETRVDVYGRYAIVESSG